MSERLHENPAPDGGEIEPGFVAELLFGLGLGLVIAGIGACTATTVALVWSALL